VGRVLIAALVVSTAITGSLGCEVKREPEPAESAPVVDEACAPGDIVASDGACLAPGMHDCPEGFVAGEPGACVALVPGEVCPPGTMAVPGEEACREISVCGEGTWGDIPVEADTQYVDASFDGASTGAFDAPWRTIADGVAAAEAGAIVAVAAGTYAEEIHPWQPVRVWGRCASMVHVASPANGVFMDGAVTAEIHDLSVTGAFGVAMGQGNLLLERVIVHDTSSRGVLVERAYGPSVLTMRDSLVENATEVGVSAFDATVVIERSTVRGTRPSGFSGRGISVTTGATLELRDSVVELNHETGVYVSGSVATIERSLVRATQPGRDGSFGGGIRLEVDDDMRMPSVGAVDGVDVGGNHTFGVLATGSSLTLSRAYVHDTYPQALDQRLGVGIQLQSDDITAAPATGAFEQVTSARNHYAAVAVSGSTLQGRRLLLRDSYPEPKSGEFGRGLLVYYDAFTELTSTAELEGVVVERSSEVGIFAQGADLILTDAVVRDVAPRFDGIGRGIDIENELEVRQGSFVGRRILVERTTDAGILVRNGIADLAVVTVQDVLEADEQFGDGIQVISDPGGIRAEATIVEARIVRSARAGLVNFGSDIDISGSTLDCNPISLNGQSLNGRVFNFVDGGDNLCGCGLSDDTQVDDAACTVSATMLTPPSRL